MKTSIVRTLLAAVLGTGALLSAHAATTLTVYTALEADQIKAYETEFKKANPDIEIKWVRDSTGVVTAKLLAEKVNPKADVVWGLAATSLAILNKEGMLTPYAPKNLGNIDAKYRSAANPPHGSVWMSGAQPSASILSKHKSKACQSQLPGLT